MTVTAYIVFDAELVFYNIKCYLHKVSILNTLAEKA